jgi:hypothetical protein
MYGTGTGTVTLSKILYTKLGLPAGYALFAHFFIFVLWWAGRIKATIGCCGGSQASKQKIVFVPPQDEKGYRYGLTVALVRYKMSPNRITGILSCKVSQNVI